MLWITVIDVCAFTLLELLSPYKISGNEFLFTECKYTFFGVVDLMKEGKMTTNFFRV